ncbi:MAG: hypothetical protein R3E12_12320 [Candidatus Eisenbacteria bacterium]
MGKFAGRLSSKFPTTVDALTGSQSRRRSGLRIRAERTDVGDGNVESLPPPRPGPVGHDRPGIVRAVSEALARSHVNVDRLTTERSSAPMSGERLFRATGASCGLPDDLT